MSYASIVSQAHECTELVLVNMLRKPLLLHQPLAHLSSKCVTSIELCTFHPDVQGRSS